MKIDPKLESGRVRDGDYGSKSSACYGAFKIVGPRRVALIIVAADAGDPIAQGWEHVSVSVKDRCPSWEEMCFVKDLFWGKDECVVQFHPAQIDYISLHPYTLHLWKWTGGEFPMPPKELV